MVRMKILFLCPHFAEYSLHLARALVRQPGVSVLLVMNQTNFQQEVGEQQPGHTLAGLEIVTMPHSRSVHCFLSNTWRYLRLMRGFQPDVIHAQEELKDYLVVPLLFTHRPVVLTIHDPRPHGGDSTAPGRFSRRALYRRYLRHRADAAIVHGTPMVSDLRAQGFKKTVVVAPHGPLGTLDNRPESQWIDGRCLFFGRLQGYKGLGDFIDAIELLAVDHPQVHGVIAGRGPDLANFRGRLANNRLFSVTERFLSAAEVVQAFENAQVVVLPYREATQSGVAAYALGIGRPLVVTRVGSLPDVVDNGGNGFIVQPRQPVALARAISAILSDAALSKTMSEHSLTLGRGRLSWETAAVTTVALYDDLRTPE